MSNEFQKFCHDARCSAPSPGLHIVFARSALGPVRKAVPVMGAGARVH